LELGKSEVQERGWWEMKRNETTSYSSLPLRFYVLWEIEKDRAKIGMEMFE
jgi:hypothetical protein